jgi:hypothetical protein
MRKLKHSLKVAFAITWMIAAAITYVLTLDILINN